MKNIKHLLAILALISIPLLLGFYSSLELSYVIIVVIPAFFILHLIIRRSLNFKNYFLNKYNFLTSKYSGSFSYDIPPELMYKKVMEVLVATKFKLVDSDDDKFEILATTPLSWMSWGENLYIDIEAKGDGSKINFNSSTLFQVYSWGINEKNYNEVINNIEESLTV